MQVERPDVGLTEGRVVYLVMCWKRIRYAREAMMTLYAPRIALVMGVKTITMPVSLLRKGHCSESAHYRLPAGYVDGDAVSIMDTNYVGLGTSV